MDSREALLRHTMSVWINSFNQPTYLKNIVEKFQANRFRNILIIDNNSDSPELQNYYRGLANSSPNVMVLYYGKNFGPRHFHYRHIYRMVGDVPHLFTDPDIDFDILADNYVSRLLEVSEWLKTPKVGSALEIPEPGLLKEKFDHSTMGHEFDHVIAENVYDAPVDTTLHLFNPKYFTDPQTFVQGARVGGEGFTVRHLPWYRTDPMPEYEYAFYKNSDIGFSHC